MMGDKKESDIVRVPSPRAVMLIERVAESLLSDPPAIIGILQEGKMFRLEGFAGDGPNRTFVFKDAVTFSYRELIRKPSCVVLPTDSVAHKKRYARLRIKFNGRKTRCPACNRLVGSGGPFWTHYSSKHAVRPFWLNRADWVKMLKGPYKPPPDDE